MSSAAASFSDDPAASECFARAPLRGDILVWVKPEGDVAAAQALGGGWSWNYVANECQDSVQWNLAVNPTGGCTRVALSTDNPGYNTDADPAPPPWTQLVAHGEEDRGPRRPRHQPAVTGSFTIRPTHPGELPLSGGLKLLAPFRRVP